MQVSKILCNFASVKQRRPLPPNVNDLTASDVECVAASMSDVRILSNMIAPWIICGACGVIAGWFIGRFRRYKKKWEDLEAEYDQAKLKIVGAYVELGELKIKKESIESELRKLKLFYDSARACQPDGYPTAYDYSVVRSEYRVCVFGKYKSYAGTDTTVCIKAIPIEDGDEDFAIREAEELIEIIQKF